MKRTWNAKRYRLALATLLAAAACGDGSKEDADDGEIGTQEQAQVVSFVRPGRYVPLTHSFQLDLNSNGVNDDPVRSFGNTLDKPVVGHWGSAHSCSVEKPKVGVFRPSTGHFFLDVNGNGTLDIGEARPGTPPVAGETHVPVAWRIASPSAGTGGTGSMCTTVIGVYAHKGGTTPAEWRLDWNNDGLISTADRNDVKFTFGDATRVPAPIRHPTGFGTIAATWRKSTHEWRIDLNANRAWDGCTEGDRCVTAFGDSTHVAVTNSALPYIGTRKGTQSFIDFNGNFTFAAPPDLVQNYFTAGDVAFFGNW